MTNHNYQHEPDDWLRAYASVPEKIDLGLIRCQKILEKLNLQKPPYVVITVAGTNGKGSTLAILDAILTSAGYLTGRYTSPHLIDFNERIQISGQALSNAEIVQAFVQIQQAADGIDLSYFEYATIAALYLFAKQQVDIALLEVGLGGRLDAVNSIDADISIITSIALDHQDWLGDDLESIGFEKAGVMRPGKLCVLGDANMPQSVLSHAKNVQAKVVQLNTHYRFRKTPSPKGNDNSWLWQNAEHEFNLPAPRLNSEIQYQNAAAALAALVNSSLWPIEEKHLAAGLSNVRMSGRMQLLKSMNRNWILDVAHNPAAVQELVNSLENNKESIVKSSVFAMLSDKDVKSCVALLKTQIDDWFICELDSPRSLSLNKLESILLKEGIHKDKIHLAKSVDNACILANEFVNREERILVCGSFYTVGTALQFLNCT
jgi:dihydrofolate synthase/folylpolyglutamate synthase